MKSALLIAAIAAITGGTTFVTQASASNQPSPSSSSTSAAPASQSNSYVAKDGKICKRLDVTGSRIGGSPVCLTKEQWDRETGISRRAAGQRQTNSATR